MKQNQVIMKMKKPGLHLLAALSLVGLTACQTEELNETSPSTQNQSQTFNIQNSNPASETTVTDATATINFNDSEIIVEGSGATVSGQTVEITSGGTYYLSGTLNGGQVIINSLDEENVYLVLNGVNLTSKTSAPIYVKSAKNTIIELAEGTQNIITDSDSYVLEDPSSDEPNAAIFSKDDLKIKGTGSLTVNANYHHGIVSKDDLEIKNGVITVNATADGIKGKDSVVIEGGTLTIVAGGDGIQASNTTDTTKGYVTIEDGIIDITATLDGIQAETDFVINNGTLTLHTGGGSENSSTKTSTNEGMWGNWGQPSTSTDSTTTETSSSAKGLKAGNSITLNEGVITIDSSDDAIHSNNIITVNGGDYTVSSGDDGVHADSILEVNGGSINIIQSYEGLESTTITINDGTIYVVASDDGVNAAGGNDGSSLSGRPGQNQFSASTGSIEINGGYLYVDATGDGLDANGSITLSNGFVIVNGPTDGGNGALDYDASFNITGGTLIAAGSSQMAQTPSTSSTQPILNINTSSLNAGELINVTDSNGTNILTFAPTKTVQSIIISTPDLKLNSTYTISSGGSSTGSELDGIYEGGTYSNGTELGTMTLSSVITSLGQSGGINGGFGVGPGGQMNGGNRRP